MLLSDVVGKLDNANPLPKYQQLARAIERAIERGALPQNDALPPEREIAHDMDVSRITVRKAIDGLVGDGLLSRRQGAGTFVTGRVEKPFSRLSSFTEDMAGRGWTASSRWVEKKEGVISPEESLNLGLGPTTPVYRLTRVRYADGTPMAIETTIVPSSSLPSIETIEGSLYVALNESGHRPVRALQRLRAVSFIKEQAELLDVKEGDPGLFIERRGFLANGNTVEITQSYYRGDAYDFVAELHA